LTYKAEPPRSATTGAADMKTHLQHPTRYSERDRVRFADTLCGKTNIMHRHAIATSAPTCKACARLSEKADHANY